MKYKVYTTDGSELIATSITRADNKAGKGYRIEADINGHKAVLFYKLEEVPTIMQLREE